MKEIAIISASVRMGRLSHRVALYFKRYLECNNLANAEILDLKEYNFPVFDERHHKPVAISTVSDGSFGGSQVLTSLQFSLWKMKIRTVTAMFPVPRVMNAFDENGIPSDKEATDKRAANFIKALLESK
ncbi:MAG TPA: hypothetical protein PKX27_10835 [Bacteroidales bacterium]|nr:hypothetical protein [Bacteroidales bacterium]HOX74028.1 hypothetical protein [Bacteroidales bacterium]HPM88471.1 hypothetical protein [Bacteroidales bacterium]HQM67994.1 hypothetical protein [Bacteroidales bacterium]